MIKKTYTIWYGIIGILLLPVFYYSILTPFALIDDLRDWKAIFIFDAPKEWLNNILFTSHNRFRPTWELYNALMWSILGDNPYLHHLIRLSLKLLPIFFFYKTLKRLLNDQDSLKLILLSFVVVYLFTPNAPDARLGPQETLLVLFLSISLYFYVKIKQSSFTFNANYMILLLAFLLLAGSKETALPLLLAIIISLAFIGPRTYKNFLLLLPFLTIFFLLVYHIYRITHAHGYATTSISLQLIINNINYIFRYVFMGSWAFLFIIPLLLISPVLLSSFNSLHSFLTKNDISIYKNKIKLINLSTYRDVDLFIILVLLSFVGSFLLATTFWVPSLRYFYPLTFLWAIIFSFSLNYIWVEVCKKNNVFILVTTIGLSFFIYLNYYNFLNQYTVQYEIRTNEKKLLASIKNHLTQGDRLSFLEHNEYTQKITIYFNTFLHHFYGEPGYGISNTKKKMSETKVNVLYLSSKELNPKEFEKIQTFKPVTPKMVKSIQHILPSSWVWKDYGASRETWYLNKKIEY